MSSLHLSCTIISEIELQEELKNFYRFLIMSFPLIKVIASDQGDCERYGLDHILATFSIPHDLKKDDNFKNTAEFVGRVDDREHY